MDLESLPVSSSEFVETASGNKISRNSILITTQNIKLSGKAVIMPGCIIRGDLATVKIGRNVVLQKDTVIRPPFKKYSKGIAYFPLQIGDYSFIDDNCIVNAAQIGSYVFVGKNCGRRCILKDCSSIADNTVLAPETVVPSFTLFSGSPERFGIEQTWSTGDFALQHLASRFSLADTKLEFKENSERIRGRGSATDVLPECTQDLMKQFTHNFFQTVKLQ